MSFPHVDGQIGSVEETCPKDGRTKTESHSSVPCSNDSVHSKSHRSSLASHVDILALLLWAGTRIAMNQSLTNCLGRGGVRLILPCAIHFMSVRFTRGHLILRESFTLSNSPSDTTTTTFPFVRPTIYVTGRLASHKNLRHDSRPRYYSLVVLSLARSAPECESRVSASIGTEFATARRRAEPS